jgi:hypothetical protein
MALQENTENKDQQVSQVYRDLEDQQALLDHQENEEFRELKERMDSMESLGITERMVNKESRGNPANQEWTEEMESTGYRVKQDPEDHLARTELKEMPASSEPAVIMENPVNKDPLEHKEQPV